MVDNMKKIEDGWYVACGYNVYVEDGVVVRGTKTSYTRIGEETAYPYIAAKGGGWDLCQSLTLNALRARMRRGTAIMS